MSSPLWTGRMEIGRQEFSHGVLDVWFLTRPGLDVPDPGIPLISVPERFSGKVEIAVAGPSWRKFPSELEMDLDGLDVGSRGVKAVGRGGKVYLDADQIGANLARLDLERGSILYFEDDGVGDGGERDLVREAPNGLVVTAAEWGDLAIHHHDGRVKVAQLMTSDDSPYFERPEEGLPFWSTNRGPVDLSCGQETFIVLHDDSVWDRTEDHELVVVDFANRIERYTYDGALVWCRRFSYASAPLTTDQPPVIQFACLDPYDRIWAASSCGAIWVFSPGGELVHQAHLGELPPAHPELRGIDWFGVDSQCRVWVYQLVRKSFYDQYLIGAGYDLGLE